MILRMIGTRRRTLIAEPRTPNIHGKRRRHSILAFEMVRLNRAASEPLHQQLYRQIRDELVSGSFNNNSSRLPSSRALAADLGLSRFTVNLALSRLHAEGYLQSRVGSGTFVAEPLPENFLSVHTARTARPIERPPRLSDRVKNIPDHRVGKQFDFGIAGPPGVSFVPAVAALDEFPIEVWERLRAQVLAQKGAHLLQYASSRGDPELRKALATYLCDYRGARCHPNQIIITAGTQQAMMICAMALVNRGEVAWIEDPGFYQARRTFGFAGATVARFLTEAFFLSHIKRMRKLYSDRREYFIEQFDKLLGKYFIVEIPEAGLHFVAWVRQNEHMPVITRVCTDIGIRPSPLSSCFMKVEPKPALTFGFAAWSRAQIREGLSKFAAALNSKLN